MPKDVLLTFVRVVGKIGWKISNTIVENKKRVADPSEQLAMGAAVITTLAMVAIIFLIGNSS